MCYRGGLMLNCLFVGIGGFIGSVCRYLIGLIPVSENTEFPIKTLCVNVIGSFLIGLIAFSVQGGKNIDPRMVLLLKVGICGGFTTFSTFSLETFGLFQKGATLTAAIYIICSVLLGLAAVLAAKTIVGSFA